MPRAAEGGRNKGREELESNAWRYANDESLDEGEEAWAVGERTSVEALLQESVPAEIYAGTESLRDLLTSLDPPAENHALDEFITWSANEAASLISAIPLSRLLRDSRVSELRNTSALLDESETFSRGNGENDNDSADSNDGVDTAMSAPAASEDNTAQLIDAYSKERNVNSREQYEGTRRLPNGSTATSKEMPSKSDNDSELDALLAQSSESTGQSNATAMEEHDDAEDALDEILNS